MKRNSINYFNYGNEYQATFTGLRGGLYFIYKAKLTKLRYYGDREANTIL